MQRSVQTGIPGNRLPPLSTEAIDRSTTFTFTWNGQVVAAFPGDTIASALAAAGVQVFSRSFKYHRPRGLLCNAGACPNCLVQVGEEPNVRACQRPVEAGMVVHPQNAWPSLRHDLWSLTSLFSRLLPVGFYYKAFIRPRALWPIFERMLRQAAGLGRVSPATPRGDFDKQYLHVDVVVIGGGPAGISAALAAARQGARVALFDENPRLGGHLCFTGRHTAALLPGMLAAIEDQPNLTTYLETAVVGWWEDHWLAAVQGKRFFKIRADRVIVATGAYEQPLLFGQNDLPGVMLGSGVQRLLHLYGVKPGQQALVVTANDDGWAVARDLLAADVGVVGLVDERPLLKTGAAQADALGKAGVPVFHGHTIQAALGRGRVRQAVIVPVTDDGEDATDCKILDCDLIAVSVGWTAASGLLAQAGGQMAYDPQRAEFLPQEPPQGVWAAGRVSGTHDLDTQLAEGRLAGIEAAASLGLGSAPTKQERAWLSQMQAAAPCRTSGRVFVPGRHKQFLCYCEDVTKKDLETAVAEGYDSIELLKRYSTISMGPCQGKMCSANSIRLCARATGCTVAQTGTTTARPPISPVSLGSLAGQGMEPVRVTPIHDWHLARGAKMLQAGLWLRAEHYGDPLAEVQAVRQQVGIIDVSTLGKLRLTGPGVPDFLDRIYANRWRTLSVGRVRYGVMCNEEGIVLDDGVTARLAEDEWYTTTTSSGTRAMYEWMLWWLQSGWGVGVHVTDLTDSLAALNLAGPQSRAVLQQLTKADVSGEAFPYLRVREIELAGVPCRVLRIGFTGELSYEIHCPAGYALDLWQSLLEAGEPFGIAPFGVEAQRVLRLEKAHIIVGQDTDALSDPLAADMAWAVKLGKEDFLGQRSLRRRAARGLEQRLVGFTMGQGDQAPAEGLQVVRQNGQGSLEIIGWVTSSRHSPTLDRVIGLCWLPADMAERAGTPFTIRVDGKLVEARVDHGPFYDPEGKRVRM